VVRSGNWFGFGLGMTRRLEWPAMSEAAKPASRMVDGRRLELPTSALRTCPAANANAFIRREFRHHTCGTVTNTETRINTHGFA